MWDIFRFNSRQIICLLIEVPKVWSYLDNQQNLHQFAFLKNLRLNTIILALMCNFWDCKCTVPILLNFFRVRIECDRNRKTRANVINVQQEKVIYLVLSTGTRYKVIAEEKRKRLREK